MQIVFWSKRSYYNIYRPELSVPTVYSHATLNPLNLQTLEQNCSSSDCVDYDKTLQHDLYLKEIEKSTETNSLDISNSASPISRNSIINQQV